MTQSEIAAAIVAAERAALDRWAQGDPDGFLELSAPGVTYFDPFQKYRLDGHDSLRALYDQFRGKIRIDRYEMIAPKVQVLDEAAVLTFDFESNGSEGAMRWHATEVYRLSQDGWRIVHTHWSLPK